VNGAKIKKLPFEIQIEDKRWHNDVIFEVLKNVDSLKINESKIG